MHFIALGSLEKSASLKGYHASVLFILAILHFPQRCTLIS